MVNIKSSPHVDEHFRLDLDRWTNIGFQPIQIDPAVTRALAEVGGVLRDFNARFRQSLLQLQGVLAEAFGDSAKIGQIEQAGWLPHSTSPFHLIERDLPSDAVHELVEAHYRENWEAVRAEFAAHVASYDLDDEAKATFNEALAAHQDGHYRSVVRLLFPEIERVACKEIYGGKQYEQPEAQGVQARQITNLTGFRRAIGELPLGDVVGFDFGMNLFQKLDEHLYKNIGRKPQHVSRYEADPVPNRHASLHGLVSYKSAQNAINMLIMTDFMFHLFGTMRAYLLAQDD